MKRVNAKSKSKSRPKKFWNKEYTKAKHLALSTKPSENLIKFTRWLERQYGQGVLSGDTKVLDLGCGNGRHLIYLNQKFGCSGVGYDISEEAIKQAQTASMKPLQFEVRSLADPLPLPDTSVDLVLDMMSTHVLRSKERENLRAEILRVLKPHGFLLLKTFLAEDDLNAKQLLRDHPADESGAYIHPRLGVYEYVWTIGAIEKFFGGDFEIKKIIKSHKHLLRGRAHKRRYVVVYLEKR
ncbi:MAG: class I SAM-dependent methyltransferase [Patescibacteria group bacterium]|nr:class I SAM-dependent methyltransferase [Patescibacteria group bacterium]